MTDDTDTSRDRLDPPPRSEWPEPWASMDTGRPTPRPHGIEDPEAGDIIDWTRGTPHKSFATYGEWHTAVMRAADHGDMAQLVGLLRSNLPLEKQARDLIAAVLSARRLKRKPGNQSDPVRVSTMQGGLHFQAAGYRYWRAKGMAHDDALHRALVDFRAEEIRLRNEEPPSVDELAERVTDEEIERLDAHIRGKHGTSRKLRKRGRV